ncbi:MAG TPA: ribosome maturation factor RimM, partial [Gemmatimonadales bacterium]|nr:ribosome maturation factor RimM [Gemmatimonadales bacterium]
RLLVGRLRKPHGLKGDVAVFPLTDEPEAVFARGREVWVQNLGGEVVAGPLVVERSRPYQREWLVSFRDHGGIEAVEPWRGHFLQAERSSLRPLGPNEVYIHELAGFAVRSLQGAPLGLVTDLEEGPGGLMLTVQGPKREFLLPYRREFVREVNREGRVLVVELPEGLTEL